MFQELELCLLLEIESISHISAEAKNGGNSYIELIHQLAIYYIIQNIIYYIDRDRLID